MQTQTYNPKTEMITFIAPPAGSETSDTVVELKVNPETLTLTWKKVLNRIRTKSRLVTLFWGEEPVKFVYRGQTGNVYPTIEARSKANNDGFNAITSLVQSYTVSIDFLESEIKRGGPYSYGTAEQNTIELTKLKTTLSSLNTTALLPGNAINEKTLHNNNLNNTQILHLSDKFKVLKALENMYGKYQDPSTAYITLYYRNYIFRGYFESFSFTDDARNPWNWIYNIDFTILEWETNTKIDIGTELIFNNGDVSLKGSQGSTTLTGTTRTTGI